MSHNLAITFIECCCYIAPGLRCRKADLWRAYKSWSDFSEVIKLPRKLIQARWASVFQQNQRHILGIELKPEEEWEYWDPKSAHNIYLITDGQLTKIGLSQDPYIRLQSLQTGSGRELFLIASGPGSYAKERQLHQRYASKRTIGEWFELTPEEQKEIVEDLKKTKGAEENSPTPLNDSADPT